MTAIFLLFLSLPCSAQDSPFYLRDTKSNNAIGGLNQNFTDASTAKRDTLTNTLSPSSCASGQSITGAQYHNGLSFGGSCSSVVTTDGNSSITGSITFVAGSTLTISPLTMTRLKIFVSSADTNGLNSAANSTHTVTLPTVDISSVDFELDYDCQLSSTNMFIAIINGDQGGHYSYAATGANSAGTVLFDGGATDHAIDFNPQGNSSSGFSAGTSFKGHFYFKTVRGLNTSVSFDYQGTAYRSGYFGFHGGGVYTGSSVPATIKFYSSPYTTAMTSIVKSGGGFMNCHTDLYRKGFQSQ